MFSQTMSAPPAVFIPSKLNMNSGKSSAASVLVSTDIPDMVSLTWPTLKLKLKSGAGPVFPGASSCRVLQGMCWVTCFICQCVYSTKTVWYQNKKKRPTELHLVPECSSETLQVRLGLSPVALLFLWCCEVTIFSAEKLSHAGES